MATPAVEVDARCAASASASASASATGRAAVAPAKAPSPPETRIRPSSGTPQSTRPPPALSIDQESGRAVALVGQSRKVVLALFEEARMGRAMDTSACLPLVTEIADSMGRNAEALISLTRLKTQDSYTYLHSVAVCTLMVGLARQLGHTEEDVRHAGVAGLLHDIGKAVMPLEILNKPARLTETELSVIQTHPLRGHELLLEGGTALEAALEVCLHHHERPDGQGYPHRLSGDQVSLLARMGSVCDVYDAVTSNRPYKAGWDPAEAIAKMVDWTRGGQFDPAIVGAFLQSMGVYPTGALVRLQSGRLAVVIAQNRGEPLKPRLKCFYSTRSDMPIPVELLDTADSRCTDLIIGRESNERWKFVQIDELWAGRETLDRLSRTLQ